jgi:predicted Zn finger-like uncharacterized protein
MIEIQCTSCQTRYRIDERILPEDTPTFKCSRCGHVFSAEPRVSPPQRASAESGRGAAVKPAHSAAEKPPPPPRPPRPPQPSATAAAAAATAAAAAAAAAAQAAVARARQAGGTDRRTAPQPTAAEPAPPAQRQEPPLPEPSPVRRDIAELLRRRFRGIPADEAAITNDEAAIPVDEVANPAEAGISADEADKAGENLAFDFNDERHLPDPVSRSSFRSYAEEKWEVGDSDVPPLPPPRPKPRIRISDIDDELRPPNLDQPPGRDAEAEFERIRPEEVSAQARSLEAELRGRSYKLHSAGYFIGLFALVILGFGIVTVVIQSAPIASAGLLSTLPMVGEGLEPPISPARRVALGQVQAQYAKLKGNQTALVISGTVENLTSATLGAVRIEAALTASNSEPLRSEAVYCGNSLSSRMIAEMTSHEIEFFEKLDAPKSFTLAPQASAPFVFVFIAPPAGAGHFQLRVVSADPAAAPPPATEGG